MDYLSLLTNEEVNDLCKVISGKIIKKFFTENPNEFARIKSGFRPSRISEDEAVSLVIQNINKTFLRRFINGQTESWLKQVKNNIDFLSIYARILNLDMNLFLTIFLDMRLKYAVINHIK